MDANLQRAASQLTSPSRAERDAAEAELLKSRGDAIPALVAVLEAPVPVGGVSPIARVALLLGALQARDALRALLRLVDGGRATREERAFIARALTEILDGRDAFDDAVRASLEKLAADDDMYTRAFAAEAFGALGDVRSKARVHALAQDREAWVRDKAGAVLKKLADAEVQAQPVGLGDFAALVADAEAQGGALKPWLDDLGDVRRPVRDAAVAELVKAGRTSVPFLVDKLNQPFTRARIGAAQALGRLQAGEACGPLLIAATASSQTAEEAELRAIALRALANCLTGVEEGLSSSLLPLSRDADRFVRAAALLCLGRLADRIGMKAVVAAILEDDPFVVESAAVALSEGVRESDVELVRPLLGALDKRPAVKPAVKEAVLIALSRISLGDPSTSAPLRVRIRRRVRRDVLGVTASTRKAAVVLLENLYGDDDPPPVSVVDDVLSRLADEHPEVRVVAASFVARHLEAGMTGADVELGRALARGERTVSLLALEALRRHDTPQAAALLHDSVTSQDEQVAARASALLVDFSPSSTSWAFAARAPAAPDKPALAHSQRPRRVRPVGDGSDVVEARFTDAPSSSPAPASSLSAPPAPASGATEPTSSTPRPDGGAA